MPETVAGGYRANAVACFTGYFNLAVNILEIRMPRTFFDGLVRSIRHVIILLADDRAAGAYRDKQEISQVFLQCKMDQVVELQGNNEESQPDIVSKKLLSQGRRKRASGVTFPPWYTRRSTQPKRLW